MRNLNRIKKSSVVVAFCYLFFLLFNIVYYSHFTVNWEYYSLNTWQDDVFYYVLNGDSVKAYYPRLGQLITNDPTVAGFFALQWSHAISYIYYFLWLIFRFDIANVMMVAFLVNNIMVVISYLYFVKIGREIIGLKMRWRGLYLLNPTLIFISQMISKEAILLAFITMFCYYSLKRKYMILFVISSITAFVKAPFAALGGMPLILRGREVRINRFLFLTIVFMLLVGVYYSKMESFESRVWKDAGITRLAFEWNYFYLGPLMMMPLKILGNFYELGDACS